VIVEKLQYGATCQDILQVVAHTFAMNVSIVGVTVITHLLKNQIYLRVKKVLIGNGLKMVVFGHLSMIMGGNGLAQNMIMTLMGMNEK
jgi:uncharacterized membrane protein